MTTSSESYVGSTNLGSNSDGLYDKGLQNLASSFSKRKDCDGSALDVACGVLSKAVDEKYPLEALPSAEFAAALDNLLNPSERSDYGGGDFLPKEETQTTSSGAPVKDNIFRKELTKLAVGTPSRKSSQELNVIEKDSSTQNAEQLANTTQDETTSEEVTSIKVEAADAKSLDDEKKSTSNTTDVSAPVKQTIFGKELRSLEVLPRKVQEEQRTGEIVEKVDIKEALPEKLEAKSEFKGVSSIVGSKTELRSVSFSREKKSVAEKPLQPDGDANLELFTTEDDICDVKEVPSDMSPTSELQSGVQGADVIVQRKPEFGDASISESKAESQQPVATGRIIPVMKQQGKERTEQTEVVNSDPGKITKHLSIGGALDLRGKPPLPRSPTLTERLRKRSHVPLSMLERLEKDPIVAKHFALLETPFEETISGVADNTKRRLHTTNRLRRTTDSVGLKYVNQYVVIKILGCGTYGKVKLCLNIMDCKLYAVKIVHRKWFARQSLGGAAENVGQGAMREIAIMKKLNHPNIVALYEVIDDPTKRKLYLVLEYVEGGPIMENGNWQPFSEDKARLYFRDMCKGIDYLHFNKIVHRDLKPGNLLQTLDGKVKITDFGVSHMFEQEVNVTHAWRIYGPSGREYYRDISEYNVPRGNDHGDVSYLREAQLAFPSKVRISDSLRDIMTLILTKDPNTRISLAGIMQHDWLTKGGTEPLVPYKIQMARGSTVMSVTDDEVKAAIGVNTAGFAALCNMKPEQRTFEEGEYIIRQGEEGNEMYLINSGQCEVLVESRSLTQPSRGRMEYVVGERGPGQYIGEMALQKDTVRKPLRRNTSIRAKTSVVVLVVSQEQVMEVLSKNTEAAQRMAETIAERDRELKLRLKALDLRMPSLRGVVEKTEEEEAPKPQDKPPETCSSCRCF